MKLSTHAIELARLLSPKLKGPRGVSGGPFLWAEKSRWGGLDVQGVFAFPFGEVGGEGVPFLVLELQVSLGETVAHGGVPWGSAVSR